MRGEVFGLQAFSLAGVYPREGERGGVERERGEEKREEGESLVRSGSLAL